MDNGPSRQHVTNADLTFADVAAQLGYTVRHVHGLKAKRKIGFVQIGRRVRFTQQQVDTYRATYLAAIEVPAVHTPPVGARLAA